MDNILGSYFLELVIFFGLMLWAFYHHLTKHYSYWEERGVRYVKPHFPFGSLKDLVLLREFLGYAFNSVYKQFPEERYCGVVELNRPVLVLRDPDLIKQVLIKDFNHFVDRAAFDINKQNDFIHLFVMGGDSWKQMRRKLTPAFSSGKMKEMFVLMAKCGEQLEKYLDQSIEHDTKINVKEAMVKYTIDIIGSCAFGLEVNSLKNENTDFYKTVSATFRPSLKMLMVRTVSLMFPSLAEILKLPRISPEIRKELYRIVSSTIKYRKENNVVRRDFLDILINLQSRQEITTNGKIKNEEQEKDRDFEGGLTLNEMVAQAFIFLAAGFETASSTLTFCLYELARHPEVQERLRREIDQVLGVHGGVTYESLHDLKYMDRVVNETLRRYASLSVIHRRCTKTYRVPNSDLVLEKGQKVYIPVYAIHHDPKYYPDPFKFDPERFSPENIEKRHPFVHIPFGEGPRNCIGMRFGLMQTKMGLITFLKSFRVDVSPDTTSPIEILPSSFVTQPKHPLYLNVTKR